MGRASQTRPEARRSRCASSCLAAACHSAGSSLIGSCESTTLPPRELRFDHTSPGVEIVSVEHDRLELNADGWDLFIETDAEGRVSPGTHLVFPLGLGGRRVRLDCRPADRATGYLRTTTREGSDELDGRFLVELANCKNAESGKTTDWPPAPLTVSGSFVGLPQRPSLDSKGTSPRPK